MKKILTLIIGIAVLTICLLYLNKISVSKASAYQLSSLSCRTTKGQTNNPDCPSGQICVKNGTTPEPPGDCLNCDKASTFDGTCQNPPQPTKNPSGITYVGQGQNCNGTTIKCDSTKLRCDVEPGSYPEKKCLETLPITTCAAWNTNIFYTCQLGTVCSATSLTCVQKGTYRAACITDSDCNSGFHCGAVPAGNNLFRIGKGECIIGTGPTWGDYFCNKSLNITCQSGYTCSNQNGGDGICQGQTAGDTCEGPGSGTCGANLYCMQTSKNNKYGGLTTYQCEPSSYTPPFDATGQTCNNFSNPQIPCPNGYTCTGQQSYLGGGFSSGTCQSTTTTIPAPAVGTEGGACDGDHYGSSGKTKCNNGLLCKNNVSSPNLAGICQRPDIGEPCTKGANGGHECTSGTCQACTETTCQTESTCQESVTSSNPNLKVTTIGTIPVCNKLINVIGSTDSNGVPSSYSSINFGNVPIIGAISGFIGGLGHAYQPPIQPPVQPVGQPGNRQE